MEQSISNGLFGGLGGLIKSGFGAYKSFREKSIDFTFNWKMAGVSFVEGIVGGIIIGATVANPVAAFLGGAGLNSIADANDLIFPKKIATKKK
jgi:hypothetical protein